MHTINPPRFPTHFKIKDHWHSINGILRNINIAAGLANGTRVILLKVYRYSLLCRTMYNPSRDMCLFHE